MDALQVFPLDVNRIRRNLLAEDLQELYMR